MSASGGKLPLIGEVLVQCEPTPFPQILEQRARSPSGGSGDLMAVQAPVITHLQPRCGVQHLKHCGREFAILWWKVFHDLGEGSSVARHSAIILRQT